MRRRFASTVLISIISAFFAILMVASSEDLPASSCQRTSSAVANEEPGSADAADRQRQQCEKKEEGEGVREAPNDPPATIEYAICPETPELHRAQMDVKLDAFHFVDGVDVRTNLDHFIVHIYEDPWGDGDAQSPMVHGYVHANRVRVWGRMLANLLREKNGVQWQKGDLEVVDILTALHDAGRQGCEGHDVYEKYSAKAIANFLGQYQDELGLSDVEVEDVSKSVINMIEPRHVPQTDRGIRMYRLENAADCLDIMRIHEVRLGAGFDATRLARVLSGADRFGDHGGGSGDPQYSLDWNGDDELRRLLQEVDAFVHATDPFRNHGSEPIIADDPLLLRQAMDEHLRKNADKYPLIARYCFSMNADDTAAD